LALKFFILTILLSLQLRANAQQIINGDTLVTPNILATYETDTNINRILPVGNGVDVILQLPYTGVQVQPIALKNLEATNNSFISAYAGTYNLLGANVYLKLGNNYKPFNFYINAETASGALLNQKYNNVSAALQHVFETKHFTIDAQLTSLLDNHYLYGGAYNHSNISSADLLQNAKNIQANIDIKNKVPNNLFRNNTLNIATYYFFQNKNTEQNMAIKAPLNLLLHANQQIELFANAQLNQQNILNNLYSNNFIQIGIAYHQESYNHKQVIHIGMQPAYINNSLKMLPDVMLSKYIANSNFKLFASCIGALETNNLKSLVTVNPFYRPNFNANASTVIKNKIGCTTTIGRHITFQTALAFSIYNNQISFANTENINNRNSPSFYINNVYTNRFALEWGSALDYYLNDHVQIGAIFNTRKFVANSDTLVIANIPNTNIYAYTAIKLKSKLTLNIGLEILKDIYKETNMPIAQKLPPYIDLSGKLNYKLSKRFDAFANCYNILNNNKYRFQNYANFGIGFSAGLKCAL
jgi:hypothetical protein